MYAEYGILSRIINLSMARLYLPPSLNLIINNTIISIIFISITGATAVVIVVGDTPPQLLYRYLNIIVLLSYHHRSLVVVVLF